MNETTNFNATHSTGDNRWYDLFSRGARDWLRHNEKVREAVREKLPELISGADTLGSNGNRTVKVPVKFLEHYRLRLNTPEEQTGVGQGNASPGDVLSKSKDPASGGEKGEGGEGDGGLQFVLELKVDDIVDWLWEELQLPHLKARVGSMDQDEYIREGLDRRGARSRLDRRRSLKESIKRRAVQKDGPLFSNEDLRYRQLVKREQPATRAVVFFAMDVSSSMMNEDRQLAKTFFFWVVQGLRRQYTHIEPVFIAHTVEAWEFSEHEFFQVKGAGGTVASKAFVKVNEIVRERFDPSQYNIYMFYASDGENFSHDRKDALKGLKAIGQVANFMGYVETSQSGQRSLQTETARLFRYTNLGDVAVGSYPLNEQQDVWDAIRGFFSHQSVDTE